MASGRHVINYTFSYLYGFLSCHKGRHHRLQHFSKPSSFSDNIIGHFATFSVMRENIGKASLHREMRDMAFIGADAWLLRYRDGPAS